MINNKINEANTLLQIKLDFFSHPPFPPPPHPPPSLFRWSVPYQIEPNNVRKNCNVVHLWYLLHISPWNVLQRP